MFLLNRRRKYDSDTNKEETVKLIKEILIVSLKNYRCENLKIKIQFNQQALLQNIFDTSVSVSYMLHSNEKKEK